MPRVEHNVEARRITPSGGSFFFGYYDRDPIDSGGRYHLALHPPFIDRPNTGDDAAPLGLVDIESGAWRTVDGSPAWNWQLGPSARWLGSDPAAKIVYNAREGGRAFARILDVDSGERRDLPLPLFDVADDGSWGISTNFARVQICRPGYGHPGVSEPHPDEPASDEDGVFRVDLQTGESELIVSLGACARTDPQSSMEGEGVLHWFNHSMISPGGGRVMFLHRWRHEQWWDTRHFVCNADGSGLKILNPGPKVSHCDWRDEDHILAWAGWGDEPLAYRLFDVETGRHEIVGEGLFATDGHCHYRVTPDGPDGRWFVTDTYPDKNRMRTLMLYDHETGTRWDIGRFLAPEGFDGEIRCDLHPRWDRSGRLVTIDSLHEGFRGIYMLDVGEIVGS